MNDAIEVKVNDSKQRVGLFIGSMSHHFELTADEAVALGERLLDAAVSLVPTMKATPLLIALLTDPPTPNERLRSAFKRHQTEVESRD